MQPINASEIFANEFQWRSLLMPRRRPQLCSCLSVFSKKAVCVVSMLSSCF